MFALLDCSELPLRPEPGRPWTTSPSPWTAGTAASGCTLAAHRLGRVAHRRPTTGGTPPEPPAALRAAQLFEISQKPENRQGLGVGHGQPQAVAHPRHRRTRARNPSGWVTEAAGARCAKARQGAQPWGSGGASPLPGSALGAAGTAQAKRAGGPWTPPSGGLFTPKGRTTLRQQCVVSTLLVVARRRQRATTNGLHPKKRIQE